MSESVLLVLWKNKGGKCAVAGFSRLDEPTPEALAKDIQELYALLVDDETVGNLKIAVRNRSFIFLPDQRFGDLVTEIAWREYMRLVLTQSA